MALYHGEGGETAGFTLCVILDFLNRDGRTPQEKGMERSGSDVRPSHWCVWSGSISTRGRRLNVDPGSKRDYINKSLEVVLL